MIDIFQIATWAGAIVTIIGLIRYLVQPIRKSFTKLDNNSTQLADNLTKISHSLDLINKDQDFIYTNKLIVDRSIINVSVFDKFTMDNTLQYLENTLELENLSPFGAKLFSNDSLNFIENGIYYDNKNKVKI